MPVPLLRRPDDLTDRPAWARDLYLRRIECGLTLEALATATGIHLTALSRYENGHVRPSATQERRILDALALS